MKRYVRNIWNKDAPLWELDKDGCGHPIKYRVLGPGHTIGHPEYLYLPKSEYHEVPAPERWERCGSDELHLSEDGSLLWWGDRAFNLYIPKGYRWAWDKQEDGTLVIERKVTK